MFEFIIIANEGHYLEEDDSLQYVKFRLKIDFRNIEDFEQDENVKHISYWGDVEFSGTNEDYIIWITEIAKTVLK